MNPRLVPCVLALAALVVRGGSAAGAETNSPATELKAGNLLRDYRGSIVLVQGKNGAGSGFIFTLGGRRFLVSNAHVLADIRPPMFTTLDRSPLRFKPGPPVVAVGHDIFMMELQPGSNGIPRVESFESTVAVNDPVVVYGNTLGGEVATAISGKVVGIGPNRIEVDAEFEHGNSGSPIIHLPSGKAIGVVTYVTTDDLISGEKKIRRFGYRLDTVKQWEPVEWPRFYAEADKLKEVMATTAELRQAFLELNGLNQRTNKVRLYAYELPVIRDALDSYYSALDRAQTQGDVNDAANRLVDAINNESQSYPMSVKPTFTYEYFREQFAEDESERAEIVRLFVKIMQK